MAEWQYARLIVLYQGIHTEVSGAVIRKTYQAQHWTIQQFGPDGEMSVDEPFGTDATPVDTLNTWGRAGWELVAAFHSDRRFEYVLKRPTPSDDYDR